MDEIDAMDVTDGAAAPPASDDSAADAEAAFEKVLPAAKLVAKLEQCTAAYRERNEPLARLHADVAEHAANALTRKGASAHEYAARARTVAAHVARIVARIDAEVADAENDYDSLDDDDDEDDEGDLPVAVPIHDAAPVGRECV